MRLASVHRWMALVMAPVIAVILVTGAILALRPIVERGGGEPTTQRSVPVDVARLLALLQRADPNGTAAGAWVVDRGRTVLVAASRREPPVAYDLATGTRTPLPSFPEPTFFDRVSRVHSDLWFGLGGLVGVGTVVMIFLVLTGPFLGPIRRPRSARGWHVWMGWALWPLVALLPLSVVGMKLRAPTGIRRDGPPMAPARAIAVAQRSLDMRGVRGVQPLPGGAAFLVAVDGHGVAQRYIVTASGVAPLFNRFADASRRVHEGTWAGAWSGALNFIAALARLAMEATGLLSWWRLRRSRRSRAGSRASSERMAA